MTWKYIGEGQVIPGVPPYDMTDAEFDAVCTEYEKNNQVPVDQRGCLKRSPLYRHVKDAAPAAQED